MMTTHSTARGPLWLFAVVAVFIALALPVGRAQDPEKIALNKPEKIIGNWQSAGPGDVVTASFSEKGEFEFGGIEDGKKVSTKGTYTVDSSAAPLKLTLLSGKRRSYCVIAVLSNDRIKLEKLGSLDQKPTMDDDSTLNFTRQAGEGVATAPNKAEKLVRKWKSIGDPLALEGASLTMSFSGQGAFEMTVTEESGEIHTQRGTYTVDTTSSPMKVTVIAGDHKGYYAVEILPNDQIKMEEIKSPDETAEMAEDAFTLMRESR